MRRGSSLVVLLVASLITALGAQRPDAPSAPPSKREFDAASIKPADPNVSTSSWRFGAGGRFTGTVSTEFLIRYAFPDNGHLLRLQQIIGAPDWVRSVRFQIAAALSGPDLPPDPASTVRELAAPLQKLLEDRFKLVAHQEQRSLPIYALVLARRDGRLGPQLQPFISDCSPPPCGQTRPPTTGFAAKGVPLDVLIDPLIAASDRIVVNRTGLVGRFNITLQWSRDPSADPTGPTSIFTAVEEQLGLKLESTTDLVNVVVIDHIERPTPN